MLHAIVDAAPATSSAGAYLALAIAAAVTALVAVTMSALDRARSGRLTAGFGVFSALALAIIVTSVVVIGSSLTQPPTALAETAAPESSGASLAMSDGSTLVTGADTDADADADTGELHGLQLPTLAGD
jgi:hypothetical protein